jgi:hypothetical protein
VSATDKFQRDGSVALAVIAAAVAIVLNLNGSYCPLHPWAAECGNASIQGELPEEDSIRVSSLIDSGAQMTINGTVGGSGSIMSPSRSGSGPATYYPRPDPWARKG